MFQYSDKIKREMKDNLSDVFFGGIIILALLTIMYFINLDSIALEGEYQALEAVEEYIIEKEGLESWEVDAFLMGKDIKSVETDTIRNFYHSVASTKEITYRFQFDGEVYRVVALVEYKEIDSNWRFYKIISVEQ